MSYSTFGWIRPLNNVVRPAARLVCFPHSGGSATSYTAWASLVPADVQLLAVQYAGRGDRLAESPSGSIGEMSGRIAAELLRLDREVPFRAHVPLGLFGHSLGAVIAYETALTLRGRGRPPAGLFVSGSAAPGARRSPLTHRTTDAELWSAVCALGGVDPAIAENPDLRDLVLPALRADVRAGERYRPAPGTPPLSCPIRCYHSPEDPLTRDADMAAWAARTTGDFTLRERPGGHFHLWKDAHELVEDLVSALSGRHDALAV
jgi:pyochelin biosynthetic protein PchC